MYAYILNILLKYLTLENFMKMVPDAEILIEALFYNRIC